MSAPGRPKVCIIGLDGGTFAVLDRWVESGDMPHLADLMARGSRAELISTIPPVTGPAWTSMTTGVRPDYHGIWDFVKWSRESVFPRVVTSADCTVPRIWDLAGDAGLRVGAFAVPVTYPAWPVNGFMVSGLLTPRSTPAMVHPAELFDDLAALGLHAHDEPGPRTRPFDRVCHMLDCLMRSDRALRLLLAKQQPDCFMYVCSELDHLQHLVWSYCVQAPGADDPDLQTVVRTFFRSLDGTIGLLKDHFGKDATYFVVSDHGFGPAFEAFRINNYLARRGFLKVRRWRVLRARALFAVARPVKAALKWLGLLGVARVMLGTVGRRSLVRLGRRHREFAMLGLGIEWRRTTAIARSHSECGIWVNVRGRSPVGIVQRGEHYERVVRDLVRALKEARHPGTGQPVVTQVGHRSEGYDGPFAEEAPDIFFALGDGTILADNSLGGPLFVEPDRTATHRMEGVLVAAGPHVRQGASVSAHILDVAPTALYALGLPVPRYMQGAVLSGLFDEAYAAGHPVRQADVDLDASRKERPAAETSPEDEAEVQRRLRDMGYL